MSTGPSFYALRPLRLIPCIAFSAETLAVWRGPHCNWLQSGTPAGRQLIMHGRQHLVGIKALEGGLVLSILRYPNELRDFTPYFEGVNAEPKPEAVGLAKELIEAESGRFEPEKIPDGYAETLHELLRAKVEQRAPQIEVAPSPSVMESSSVLGRRWRIDGGVSRLPGGWPMICS
jgi:DNA end-binding protein Ku